MCYKDKKETFFFSFFVSSLNGKLFQQWGFFSSWEIKKKWKLLNGLKVLIPTKRCVLWWFSLFKFKIFFVSWENLFEVFLCFEVFLLYKWKNFFLLEMEKLKWEFSVDSLKHFEVCLVECCFSFDTWLPVKIDGLFLTQLDFQNLEIFLNSSVKWT